MTAGADRWIRWTTIGCVALLAVIAGTVSYLHMHTLVARHGQPGWVAATGQAIDEPACPVPTARRTSVAPPARARPRRHRPRRR